MLIGFVLAGCASPTEMIDRGTIKLGMSKQDFESKMYWGTDIDDDPGMENHGGSGYLPNFHNYTIVYGETEIRFLCLTQKHYWWL